MNANTSLAVGTVNGTLPPLDPTGLGYLPMPAISMSNLGPVPGQYVPPTPLAATPHAAMGMPWDIMQSPVMPPPQAQSTLAPMGDMIFNENFQPEMLNGMMDMQHPINMPGAGLLQGENSDDYWNALIDGE